MAKPDIVTPKEWQAARDATTRRGVDRLLFTSNILDLTPWGRQEAWEDSPDGWPHLAVNQSVQA